MPLPLLNKKQFTEIISLVDGVIKNKKDFSELDKCIFNIFKLTEKEVKHIIKFLK
jgi:hypothetical protein